MPDFEASERFAARPRLKLMWINYSTYAYRHSRVSWLLGERLSTLAAAMA